MNKKKPVYLDYNATTPLDEEVLAAMLPFLTTEFGNPSSSHIYGVEPHITVEKARKQIADLLGCASENIVFTSGGTESNNWVIMNIAHTLQNHGNHIITSQIEHPSVLNPCAVLEGEGFSITRLPVDEFGQVALDELEEAIRPSTILISIMHGNNEIGTLQPVKEIASIARKHNIFIHTDAAQSIGKLDVNVNDLGVDFLSLAGHKLYAPKGIGALFIKTGSILNPLLYGGGQERGLRPGTENVAFTAAMGEACRIAGRDLSRNMQKMKHTRDILYKKLSQGCEIKLNGHPEKRLPNTLNLSFRDVRAGDLINLTKDIAAVSTGSACHANSVTVSSVISALGLDSNWAAGTIRFSTGKYTEDDEIIQAAEAFTTAWKKLSRRGNN
jgi:cysteine desulfurase